MELSLAISPCPNDTFAFHAMINRLVDTEGLVFRTDLADVEELNRRASLGLYDICKLSYHAFFGLTDRYRMLRSGSALGFNNGPLLVRKKTPGGSPAASYFAVSAEDSTPFISRKVPLIAVPGLHTTGTLLLQAAYPYCTNLKPMLFSEIEGAVLRGEADAGVLIHEGRFTYKEKGLELIRDLGEFWQESFGLPIPLGGIAVNRRLPEETAVKIGRVLKRSIRYAMDRPGASASFVMENARELSREIQQKHIRLFVNDYTLDIGREGEKAVTFLYARYREIRNPEKEAKEKEDSLFVPTS